MRSRHRRGFLLVQTLCSIGLLSVILAGYFSLLHSEVNWVTLTTTRAQALYLAEAGLDAANDLLNQDWDHADNRALFPLSERVTIRLNGQAVTVGAYDVTVTRLPDGSLKLTSTGQSLPVADHRGRGPLQYRIQRTLSMVVVRKEIPSFRRRHPPDVLELQARYFDKDGVPDLLVASGAVVPPSWLRPEGQALSAGSPPARRNGVHLYASFTDVDRDGDLDLVLSDDPSRSAPHHRGSIPTVTLSPEERLRRPIVPTLVRLQNQRGAAFLAPGWIFLPEGSLTGEEPGTEVWRNTPVYDGTLIAWWGEP